MIERRHPTELYAIELEKARAALSSLLKARTAPINEISCAAIRIKELEVRLASARFAQAEYFLDTLKARVGYLEARGSRPDPSTITEQQELEWAREALPANATALARLSEDLARCREELRALLAQTAA